MRFKLYITLFLALGVLFVMLPAAQADQIQLYFTGNTYNGQEVPYEMIITPAGTADPVHGPGAVTVWMNCDDHHDYIQTGEYWTATVYSGSSNNLMNTSMSQINGFNETQADMAYDTKAYIELNYSGANNPGYSNAIWYIFDPGNGCDAACQVIYNAATAAVAADSANGYLSFRQYTTIFSGPYTNIVNQYGNSQPQEFDLVPDGGMTLILLGSALVGLATLRRKFCV